MSSQPQVSASDLPLYSGTDEQFRIVREFLDASGFSREAVRQRVAVDLPEFIHAQGAEWGHNPSSAIDLLTWIFVLGQTSPRNHIQRFLLPYIGETMEAIGILARDVNGAYFSPVFVVPLEGLYFAADRWFNPDGTNLDMRADVVYPASSPNTLRFLNLLPRTHCERLLDIGCGSGVLGLTAAAYARRVWATDITARSCAFAEFNRRLNGIANAQILRGDLYEPVATQVFDRIVAHPPYVPVLKPNWTFSDGGEDGEQLTHKIVERLPVHLAPAGVFVCDATGSDREVPFEQRVREWLGHRQAEFDVVVLVRKSYEAAQFAAHSAKRNPAMGSVADWMQSFERQHITRILQMTLCIQHVAEPRPVFTTRRNFGDKEGSAVIDWLLRFETHVAGAVNPEWLANECLSVPPSLVMQIRSRPGDEGFTPFEYKVATQYPFAAEALIEPWMAWLLNLCNGQRTTAELFQTVVENGYIPPDAPPDRFAALIAQLAASGIVELSSFPLPH